MHWGSTFNVENWLIMLFSSTCSIKKKRNSGAGSLIDVHCISKTLVRDLKNLTEYNNFLYMSFSSKMTRFSQVFSYIIQLRQKGVRKSCAIVTFNQISFVSAPLNILTFSPFIFYGTIREKISRFVRLVNYSLHSKLATGYGKIYGVKRKPVSGDPDTGLLLKSRFDHCLFYSNSPEVLLGSTYMWSIIIICQMEEELWYRNHFFTDRQTHGQTNGIGETEKYMVWKENPYRSSPIRVFF